MRIVITGASGNVGSALLRRLVADGEHELVGICRRPPTDAGVPYDAVTWHALDLADPAAEGVLTGVMAGADAAVHLAWGFQPSRRVGYLERANVEGSRAVFAAAVAARVPHLVHQSSLGVYSPGPSSADGHRVDESWPRDGVPSLSYSRQKVAVERILDELDELGGSGGSGGSGGIVIARMRPGIIFQREAGSALLRYGVPALIPARALRLIPLVPLDRRLVVQAVHAEDVADALVRVLVRRAEGAFNLAAEPVITRDDIARALGARGVHVPLPAVRAVAALAWKARLQPVDPAWLDLGYRTPLLDAGRARRELGWEPTIDAHAALAQALRGMQDAASAPTPALRARTVGEQLTRLARRGPVAERRLP